MSFNQQNWEKERPYTVDSTGTRPLSEVKQLLARLVLRWGTTLESLVLFFCSVFISFSLLQLSLPHTIRVLHYKIKDPNEGTLQGGT